MYEKNHLHKARLTFLAGVFDLDQRWLSGAFYKSLVFSDKEAPSRSRCAPSKSKSCSVSELTLDPKLVPFGADFLFFQKSQKSVYNIGLNRERKNIYFCHSNQVYRANKSNKKVDCNSKM